MALPLQNLYKVDDQSFDYIYEENIDIPLTCQKGIVRCNVYRPKTSSTVRVPVLATYGPYGKDIHYSKFNPKSFAELPDEQKSPHSAWETPDPGFWTKQGFAVVRADEVGLGQSPGFMDTMSASTSKCFKDVIEWAADQCWSNGKVGLLGISYYAGSQWRVAARQPKGLTCIIPWEGMADYYRDRCRHGGILSNTFIDFWWDNQVGVNQYGLAGRVEKHGGPETLEGNLNPEQLARQRNDQRADNEKNHFMDEPYYASRTFELVDIKVPLLSVGNWGGILLHLRGNILGYMGAGSALKYLRFVVGRHDLPFYSEEAVKLQLSFLNAFLKGEDEGGWLKGSAPKVDLVLRKGDVGYKNPAAEKSFPRRTEDEWPIARTRYTKYHLCAGMELNEKASSASSIPQTVSYQALGNLKNQHFVQFISQPFACETEFTGHIVAHLNVSASRDDGGLAPMDMDLFLTLRHISAQGSEVLYTGTVGDPVPVTKGWLRMSLREVNVSNPQHQPWLPYRDYLKSEEALLDPGKVYEVDVEMWATNVIVEKGSKLVFEISSGDTQGAGIFEHSSATDRSPERLQGSNHIHLGPTQENWLMLPMIPPK